MKDLNAYVAKFYKAPEEVLDAHNLESTTPEILTITRKKIKDRHVMLPMACAIFYNWYNYRRQRNCIETLH